MTRRRYGSLAAAVAATLIAACGQPAVIAGHPRAEAPTSVATTPARTAAETIPSDTAFVDLLYHPPAAGAALVHAPVSGAVLRLLIATVNALPVQPQATKTCPPAGFETAQITIDGAAGRLQFRASLGACGVVDVTSAGVAQPQLQVSDALRSVLRVAAAPPPPAPHVGPLEPALRPVAHSPKAAAREADAALLLVHLPEAVQDSPVTAVPPDDVFTLGVPSVVERQTGWTAAMTPNDLSDYEQAHPPAGFRASEFESGGGTVTQGFTTAANPDIAVRVIVSPSDAGSEVLINAQVFWTPAKPAVEIIAGAVSASVRYVAPQRPNGKPGATTELTLHGSRLKALVRAVDALATRPVDVVSGCGADDGETATLRVHNRGHLVVFVISLSGCAQVDVTSDGVDQPVLDVSEALEAAIRTAAR